MRIGIIFGGPSREREISFAGGRTIYDNLNKALFEAVPIFVDSNKQFILLNWEYVYKGTIRDFYPPSSNLPDTKHNFQIYIESLGNISEKEYLNIISKVGKKIEPSDFSSYFDFAFLALHGHYGEDGIIQGLLESLNIPYTGSGILPCTIGINKHLQKKLMLNAGVETPQFKSLTFDNWLEYSKEDKQELFSKVIDEVSFPFVIKPANQGSSLGVSVLEDENFSQFSRMVEKAFFIQKIKKDFWINFNEKEKELFIRELTDIRVGIGLPVRSKEKLIYHPEELFSFIDSHFKKKNEDLLLYAIDGEHTILFESFINGKEFSCIVIQDENGKPLALPPTEIVKGNEIFDYRSKYLAGLSRKETPINLSTNKIELIREQCENLFTLFEFNVYARIDGFITDNGTIYLNDPNTTSGMLPSSFFFHQAAEIGLNPSQFITYLIQTSLKERLRTSNNKASYNKTLDTLEASLKKLKTNKTKKLKIAIFLGGFSYERHISVESGRNIYEKLASSKIYEPIPVFISGNENKHDLHLIPVNLLLKDNADDIISKLDVNSSHEIIEKIKSKASKISANFAYRDQIYFPKKISYDELAKIIDCVFIALHGRPGEDGTVQEKLEERNIPYNGSGISSSKTTINKYLTNQKLKEHGLKVFEQSLVYKDKWIENSDLVIQEIENIFTYPFIAKPVDEGCSSAVKVIHDRLELNAFSKLIFRTENDLPLNEAKLLKIDPKEEIPIKQQYLIEEMAQIKDAENMIEITGGLLTHHTENGIKYEIFEPSEAVASKGILSLEEKFLAGEGQNITPARFHISDPLKNREISEKVRSDLENVARILNIEGYARIDAFVMIYKEYIETLIIEVNSLPGMTPATCIFHQAAINSYKPFEFIDSILNYGIKKTKSNIHA